MEQPRSLWYRIFNGVTNTATAITIVALAALTPTVTLLIGIFVHRQDVCDLRAEMIAMCKDVHADLFMIHERVANVEGRQSR